MLTIRMQRTGRKGYATFRVVVQDSRFTPTSGRIVAKVGHSNPHTKETVLDIEKISEYLKHGAQPSPRVVRLLLAEKVKLPDWVTIPSNDKKKSVKNTDKLRKNQPKEAEPRSDDSSTTEEPVAEEVPTEAEAPVVEETPAETEEEKTDEKTGTTTDA